MNYLQFISENIDYNVKKDSVIYNLYNEVSNFSYGVLTNKGLETDQSKFSLQYMLNNYRTLNEREIKKYKSGICLDHSFYISRKLNKMGIKNTLYFLNGYWKSSNLCLCHVFCIANLNNNYYYIETAAGDYNGVYKSKNYNDLLKRVVNMIKVNGEDIGKALNSNIGKFSYDLLNIHNNIPDGHTSYFDCFKYFYKNGEFCMNQHCKIYLFAICNYYSKQKLNETLVPKVLMKSKKEVTLYHGSPEYYNVLKPTGINFGNRLEKPSWSIFCFTDFETAKNWAAFRALNNLNRQYYAKTGIKVGRHLTFDSFENIGQCRKESFDDICNILIGNKKIKFYVYEFKAPINKIGLGNDSTHDEYTYNEEVKNYKLHTFILNKNNVKDYLIPRSDEELEMVEINTKKHSHRGLATLLYDRDYSGQDREMINAIFRDKEISPGDDIESWMKENNYKFNKTLRLPGTGYLNEEYKYKDDFQKILNFYNSMKDYKYGFYAKGKKYTGDILDKPNIFDNYRTMSSDMIKKYKVCVCWDAVKYEAEWFKENVPNIKYKCYYCEYEPKIGNTHTWLVFEYNGEKYVFEKTWYSHRGIKKVNIKNKNTINQYISDIPKSDYSSNELKNAKYVLFEYDPLKEKNGLSCSEFMNNKWFNGKLLKTNCKDKKELFNTFEFDDKEKELLMKKSFLNEEYERPYSLKEIRKNYGEDYYNKLKNDPVHRWRAETGIELIHREPSKEELERIMKNWESMDNRRKRLSDKKSMEVFGCSNKDNYNKLIKAYNETNLDTLIFSPESIIQKEVTLYHGTRNKIPNKIIDPAYGRLNVGNKFNKRVRYSTWWVKDPTFAVTYSVQDHIFDIMREKGYFPENYKFNTKTFFDIISGHFYNDPKNRTLWIDEKLKDDFIKRCNNKPGYVYSTTVPWNIVSRGHDIGLDEYTLDEPVECNEHIINFNNLKKFVTVKFASKDEILLRCGRQQRELHDVSLLKRFAYYPQSGKINRGTVAIQHGENLTRRKQEKYNK